MQQEDHQRQTTFVINHAAKQIKASFDNNSS
jgi:hypothetical protein